MLFASYNIQYSLGKDGHYDLGRIAEEIGGADIIALQEVDRHWERTDFADQPAQIGALLPDFHWIYGPPLDVDASSPSVSGKIHNRRRQFGDMLLSRWPILSSRLYLLPRHRTFDKFNPQYGALEGVVDCPGGPLRVYSLHLGYVSAAERQDQLAFLLAKIRAAHGEGGAWSGHEAVKAAHWSLGDGPPAMPEAAVLMGDFNFQPGSLEYDMVAGPADPIYGRLKVAHHFVDSWTAAGHGEDEGITCFGDPDDPRRPAMRIDYGFISPSLAGKLQRSWIDLEAQGSDHQPYWFELALEEEG